jgi:hypothetical protein
LKICVSNRDRLLQGASALLYALICLILFIQALEALLVAKDADRLAGSHFAHFLEERGS